MMEKCLSITSSPRYLLPPKPMAPHSKFRSARLVSRSSAARNSIYLQTRLDSSSSSTIPILRKPNRTARSWFRVCDTDWWCEASTTQRHHISNVSQGRRLIADIPFRWRWAVRMLIINWHHSLTKRWRSLYGSEESRMSGLQVTWTLEKSKKFRVIACF